MKYFKNTSWLFGEKILRMVVGLFVGIWVARYLGPEQFGLFSYAQSFVGLFAAIAGLGLDGIIVRELVKDPSKQAILLGTAFRLKLIGALLVLIALAVAVKLSHQDSLTTLLIFIIASATVFQSFNVIDFFFQAKVLSKYIVYANIISLLISSVVKIALILNNAPLIAFAGVIAFDSLVLMLGFVYVFQRHSKLNIKKLQFSKIMAIDLLKDSWPLILAGVASLINMRIDQVFLGSMLDNTVVGNYAVSVRIAEIWFVLPGVIGASIYPAIISAKNVSEYLYRDRIFKLIKYMGFFSILFAIIVSYFSSNIIDLLYGDRYFSAGKYLAIYMFIGIPYMTFFVLGKVQIIEKVTKISLYVSLFSVALNVMLNYLLIPLYGGVGAVSASLIATYSAFILSVILLYKITKTWYFIPP